MFRGKKTNVDSLSLLNWRLFSRALHPSPPLLDLVLCSRVVDLEPSCSIAVSRRRKEQRLSGYCPAGRRKSKKHPALLCRFFSMSSSSSSSSSTNSAAAFAAGAALGTAAGYGLALWLLPYGGVSGALAELTDKERLADAFVSLKERFAKLTASLPGAAAEEDGETKKGGGSTTAPAPEAHPLSDPKMVLVVRRDLEMGKGKVGAQCGHAVSEVFLVVFFPGFFFSLEGRERLLQNEKTHSPPPPPLSLNKNTNKNFPGRRPLQEAPEGPRRPPESLGAGRVDQGLPSRRRRGRAARGRRGGAEAGASVARCRRRREDAGGCRVEDGAGGAGGRRGGGQAHGEAEAVVSFCFCSVSLSFLSVFFVFLPLVFFRFRGGGGGGGGGGGLGEARCPPIALC